MRSSLGAVDQHLRHAEREPCAGVGREVRVGRLVGRPAEELLDGTPLRAPRRPPGEVADAPERHARVDHPLRAEPQREMPSGGVADGDDRVEALEARRAAATSSSIGR